MNNNEPLDHNRHTLAHLLAAAVLELYPDAKPTIGPTVDNGFYYDFEFQGDDKPTEKELKDIEKRMRKLLPSWKSMSGSEVSPSDARDLFKNNPYKLELIEEIVAKNEPLTIFTAGSIANVSALRRREQSLPMSPLGFEGETAVAESGASLSA